MPETRMPLVLSPHTKGLESGKRLKAFREAYGILVRLQRQFDPTWEELVPFARIFSDPATDEFDIGQDDPTLTHVLSVRRKK